MMIFFVVGEAGRCRRISKLYAGWNARRDVGLYESS